MTAKEKLPYLFDHNHTLRKAVSWPEEAMPKISTRRDIEFDGYTSVSVAHDEAPCTISCPLEVEEHVTWGHTVDLEIMVFGPGQMPSTQYQPMQTSRLLAGTKTSFVFNAQTPGVYWIAWRGQRRCVDVKAVLAISGANLDDFLKNLGNYVQMGEWTWTAWGGPNQGRGPQPVREVGAITELTPAEVVPGTLSDRGEAEGSGQWSGASSSGSGTGPGSSAGQPQAGQPAAGSGGMPSGPGPAGQPQVVYVQVPAEQPKKKRGCVRRIGCPVLVLTILVILGILGLTYLDSLGALPFGGSQGAGSYAEPGGTPSDMVLMDEGDFGTDQVHVLVVENRSGVMICEVYVTDSGSPDRGENRLMPGQILPDGDQTTIVIAPSDSGRFDLAAIDCDGSAFSEVYDWALTKGMDTPNHWPVGE